MSIRGELPFPEPEYALSPEVVLGFRDQIVFPAIDALSANNIITEAPPGSMAGFEYTIPCPIGTVQLGAEDSQLSRVFTNYDREYIRTALADIGVPLHLLDIPFAEEGIIVVDPPGTGVDG